MIMISDLENALIRNRGNFHPVVKLIPSTQKIIQFDFTEANTELTETEITDTKLFSAYIERKLISTGALFGIGGYNENRKLYKRSGLFSGDEPRSIHLGIDVWGQAGTPVYAPLGGMIHSFAYNNNFGDYGATLILLHQLETIAFYTLYGHLRLADINKLSEGAYITRGEVIGHFGNEKENGNWPPHLHFQIINDIQLSEGDYPGVCKPSEAGFYLGNCPNADLILNMMQFVN